MIRVSGFTLLFFFFCCFGFKEEQRTAQKVGNREEEDLSLLRSFASDREREELREKKRYAVSVHFGRMDG